MKMITISFCILIVVDVCISVRIRSMYDQSKCLRTVSNPSRSILIAEKCSEYTTLGMLGDLESGWWQIKTNEWWIKDGKRPWPYGNIGTTVRTAKGNEQLCVMLNPKTDEAEIDHLCKNGDKIKLTYVESNSGMGWHIIYPYDNKNPCLTYNKGEPYNVYFGDCHLTNGKWETNEMWLIEDY
jgi:hypothetical protein